MNHLQIAIVGATGAVGEELLQLLSKKNIPPEHLHLFASERSLGKKIPYLGKSLTATTLGAGSFKNIDLAFFSAGSSISKTFVPIARDSGSLVIDNSSAFRKDPKVPLLIPEVNSEDVLWHEGVISSPNCTATILLMVLFPLLKKFPVEKVVVSTYQAASGAGRKAMEELQEETLSQLEGRPFTRTVMPFPYAFNLFVHNSPLTASGYVEEELKVIEESRKILKNNDIQISPTCIRVPVLRAHSEAIYIEFKEKVTKEMALDVLAKAPGVACFDTKDENHFPMPVDVSGKEKVFCGRIREDLCHPRALHLWAVGDQLLKGAALNMLQIAEMIYEKEGIRI